MDWKLWPTTKSNVSDKGNIIQWIQLYVLTHHHNMQTAFILLGDKALQLQKHYRIPDGTCHLRAHFARTENWLEHQKMKESPKVQVSSANAFMHTHSTRWKLHDIHNLSNKE